LSYGVAGVNCFSLGLLQQCPQLAKRRPSALRYTRAPEHHWANDL